MSKNNKTKTEQLGMPFGTANGRLRKSLIFHLVKQLNQDICHRCKKHITELSDFSIEHKISWLHSESPIELFFDMENISFSHLKCNISFANKPKKHNTEEERIKANRESNRLSYRRMYSSEKRRKKYLETGH